MYQHTQRTNAFQRLATPEQNLVMVVLKLVMVELKLVTVGLKPLKAEQKLVTVELRLEVLKLDTEGQRMAILVPNRNMLKVVHGILIMVLRKYSFEVVI